MEAGQQNNEEQKQGSIEVEDLVQLEHLSEDVVLSTLARRFGNDRIYTSIGPILVSINPYQPLNLYQDGHYLQYAPSALGEAQPAHLFQVVRRAFRNAMGFDGDEKRKNQAILISGESGAGKTEATKLVLRYLARASCAVSHTPVEGQIVAANPILEAFGNAKTLRNDNSSRFGKWVDVSLNARDGTVCGGRLIHYLLEASRVCKQTSGEANFHIFHQLCFAGAVKTPEEGFAYLRGNEPPPSRASGTLEETRAAMSCLQFSESEQKRLLQVVAGVLWLGNVAFVPSSSSSSSSVQQFRCELKDEAAKQALSTAARLLGFENESDADGSGSFAAFERALRLRVMVSVRQTVIPIPRTAEQASATCDALAMRVYGAVFKHLVWRINQTLRSEAAKDTVHVGVLDIFGFEVFEHNSFEQLCINFANERLQANFIEGVFEHEIKLYEQEEVEIPSLDFPDNRECVELLRHTVFPLLADTLSLPRGTDASFVDTLIRRARTHPAFFAPRMASEAPLFGITHYAQAVLYDATDFLAKNGTRMQDDLVQLMRSSADPLVCALFAPNSPVNSPPSSRLRAASQIQAVISPRSRQRAASVFPQRKNKEAKGAGCLAVEFQKQLQQLLASIQASTSHFVRCFKPNDVKQPKEWDDTLLLRQLRTSGLFDTVRIRQLGYGHRVPAVAFLRRYRCLLASPSLSRAGHSPLALCASIIFEAVRQRDKRGLKRTPTVTTIPAPACINRAASPLPTRTMSRRTLKPDHTLDDLEQARLPLPCEPQEVRLWELGRSRVFFRSELHAVLERQRERQHERGAGVLQWAWRGHVARRDLKTRKRAFRSLCRHLQRLRSSVLVQSQATAALNCGCAPQGPLEFREGLVATWQRLLGEEMDKLHSEFAANDWTDLFEGVDVALLTPWVVRLSSIYVGLLKGLARARKAVMDTVARLHQGHGRDINASQWLDQVHSETENMLRRVDALQRIECAERNSGGAFLHCTRCGFSVLQDAAGAASSMEASLKEVATALVAALQTLSGLPQLRATVNAARQGMFSALPCWEDAERVWDRLDALATELKRATEGRDEEALAAVLERAREAVELTPWKPWFDGDVATAPQWKLLLDAAERLEQLRMPQAEPEPVPVPDYELKIEEERKLERRVAPTKPAVEAGVVGGRQIKIVLFDEPLAKRRKQHEEEMRARAMLMMDINKLRRLREGRSAEEAVNVPCTLERGFKITRVGTGGTGVFRAVLAGIEPKEVQPSEEKEAQVEANEGTAVLLQEEQKEEQKEEVKVEEAPADVKCESEEAPASAPEEAPGRDNNVSVAVPRFHVSLGPPPSSSEQEPVALPSLNKPQSNKPQSNKNKLESRECQLDPTPAPAVPAEKGGCCILQ